MTSLSEYYEENLYPLQNGVLRAVENCSVRFYLTGGTALSRAYYNHRYSDDLDFFVNNDSEYDEQTDIVLARLREEGFFWDDSKDFIKAPNFRTLKVQWNKSDIFLKLDFVNDSTPHFGDFTAADFFNRIDPVRNILSNKLGAIFRLAGKDVADIREIALHESVNWNEIINEARHKDVGVELSYIAEIMKSIPISEFEGVHWIKNPGWETFQKDIEKIVIDMLTCA
jgi:predicted nucleotidyltransferase component of viral defense system